MANTSSLNRGYLLNYYYEVTCHSGSLSLMIYPQGTFTFRVTYLIFYLVVLEIETELYAH